MGTYVSHRYNDDPAVMRELARRFNIGYLIVVDQDLRHPGQASLNEGRLPDFLQVVHADDRLLIAKFVN